MKLLSQTSKVMNTKTKFTFNTATMYKLKERYKKYAKYFWTSLDISKAHSKEDWLKAGFKETIIELTN